MKVKSIMIKAMVDYLVMPRDEMLTIRVGFFHTIVEPFKVHDSIF